MKKLLIFGFFAALSVIIMLYFIIDPAKYNIFPRCIFYSLTGLYCPGCGSQRAIHCLLHYDLSGVVKNNILIIPAVIVILFHYFQRLLNHLLKWKSTGILYLKNTPWMILGIIVIFWILRNLPLYPFTVLAPA